MIKTTGAKMSNLSSVWMSIDKADNLQGKFMELLQGRDVDNLSAPEAFLLYQGNTNRMFKKEIFNLINDGKIVIKYNPLVAVGLYMPYSPIIADNGQVKVVVNATSYCSESEGKLKIDVTELMGLCQGAYAIYVSLIKYSTICSNFQMRRLLIELYTQVILKGLTGSSVFSSASNLKYLKYICARFLIHHHFGIEKDVHETALNLAKIETDVEKAFINELVLETPKTDWDSFHGVVKILNDRFIALKGKVSVESIRQRVAIILGSANTFAIDYIPYLCALASGYYTNYAVYVGKGRTIKQDLQPYCIGVCQDVLQRL